MRDYLWICSPIIAGASSYGAATQRGNQRTFLCSTIDSQDRSGSSLSMGKHHHFRLELVGPEEETLFPTEKSAVGISIELSYRRGKRPWKKGDPTFFGEEKEVHPIESSQGLISSLHIQYFNVRSSRP